MADASMDRRRHACPRCNAPQPWFALSLTARGGLRRLALQPFAPCPGCGLRLRLVPHGSDAALALAQTLGGAASGAVGMLALLAVIALTAGAGWPAMLAGLALWFIGASLIQWRLWQVGIRHLWRLDIAADPAPDQPAEGGHTR